MTDPFAILAVSLYLLGAVLMYSVSDEQTRWRDLSVVACWPLVVLAVTLFALFEYARLKFSESRKDRNADHQSDL